MTFSAAAKSMLFGTIHLRRGQIFTIFDPYPPYHRHSSKMLMKGIFDPYVL